MLGHGMRVCVGASVYESKVPQGAVLLPLIVTITTSLSCVLMEREQLKWLDY